MPKHNAGAQLITRNRKYEKHPNPHRRPLGGCPVPLLRDRGMEMETRPARDQFARFLMKTNCRDPKYCRIVLTGGPGGGKTTAADLFRREIGDRVVIVPEAATILF